uniref:M-phase phosphoprotein 10 n=1 Tax=Rousettus aegyptiacus TaxID=9407 RepID=A0A7J8CJS3_ROUAE|nr:M-phase phosphoprotein 10 [Rousettus aegyptiacus]
MAPRIWRRRALERCLGAVRKATGRPESFLTVQDELASDFISLTKVLYDFNKVLENGSVRGSPLQKLVIDNFDDEQIWQQLELQNEPVLQFFENAVSDTIESGDISLLPKNEEQECEEDGSEMEADGQEDLERDEEEEVSGPSGDDAKGDETAKHPSKSGLRKSPVFSDEDSDLDFDISKLEQQSKVQNKVPRKPREKSVVDDKFFKLSEMEAFLENMEKEEEQRDDSEEEEVDFFEDVSSDEDEGGLFGSEKLKSGKSSRNLQYKDYFDPVESDEDKAGVHDDKLSSDEEEEIAEEGEEGISETDEGDDLEQSEDSGQHKETVKRVTFALPDDEEMEDTDVFSIQKDSDEVKSSFEKRQEKMNEKIASLEKELLEKKPWQLQGEVTAQKRPENSLLEETLHFDHAVRMGACARPPPRPPRSSCGSRSRTDLGDISFSPALYFKKLPI